MRFFRSTRELRDWFEAHHATETEIWVGFYKAHVDRVGVGYPAAVDEALCFGWIDTMVRRVDAERYTNRFVPRRPGSHWTESNRARFRALDREGRVAPSGRAAYADSRARDRRQKVASRRR